MKSFLKKRDVIQREVSQNFADAQDGSLLLHEIATGLGKTHIAIMSALEKRKKRRGPIIISTNTNLNAKNIVSTYHTFSDVLGANPEDIVIEIGKSNYIDIGALYEALEAKAAVFKNITLAKLKKQYTLNTKPLTFINNVLLDTFLEEFGFLPSDGSKFTAFLQGDSNSVGSKSLKDIEAHLLNAKIIVTNHAYLIILLRHYGNNKLKIDDSIRALLFQTPIIMDEFHTLYDAAKSILSNRFSLFRLKYSIDALLRLEEKNITVALKQKLRSILGKIHKTQQAVSGKNETQLRHLLADFKTEIGGAKKLNTLINALSKYHFKEENSAKYLRFTLTELKELAIINLHRSIGTRVELSQKGYPSVNVANGVPSYHLRNIIWTRHQGTILAMSGTLRTQTAEHKESFKWVLERAGVFLVDMDEFKTNLQSSDLEDEVQETILLAELDFRKKLENITTKKHPSLFLKSNYLYTIVKDEMLAVPDSKTIRNEELHQKKKDIWRKEVGKFISNTMMNNALVLAVGYEDVHEIAKEIAKNRTSIKVHCAKEGISIHQTVLAYKEDVEAGHLCCLVGTDQYYTGLNLPGEFLSELYMCKIPYKIPTGSIGKKIFKHHTFTKNESYINETLMKFTQGKGRPIRSFSDKALFYLLDNRALLPKNAMYQAFLDESALEFETSDLLKRRKSFMGDVLSKTHYHDIYALFYPAFKNTLIEEVVKALKIEKPKEIDKICGNLLLSGAKLSDAGDFANIIKSDKFEIYAFLLKLAINLAKKNYDFDAEAIIVKNALFGCKNLKEFSQRVLRREKFDGLELLLKTIKSVQ